MTPLAPRTPYTALAAASFNTENDAIFSGSISCNDRSTASTRTIGLALPVKVLMPLIQKSELLNHGLPLRWTAITPDTIPARLLLSDRLGVICNFAGSTLLMAPTTDAFFWVPNPTTTTSSMVPWSVFIVTAIVVDCVMPTSWVMNPTELKTSVVPGGTSSMINLPLASDAVLRFGSSFTLTVTPSMGLPCSSDIVPFSVRCCATAAG